MKFYGVPYALIICLVCLFPACDRPKEATNESRPKTAKLEKGADPAKSIDLGEEAFEAARKLEQAVIDQDSTSFDELLDIEFIIEQAFDGIKLPPDFTKGMRRSMVNSQKQISIDLFQSQFDLVSLVEGGTDPVIRFRIRKNGGIDYGDYKFRKLDSGDWKIIDIHTYSVGTQMSALLREMAIPMLAEMDKSIVERMLKGNRGGVLLQSAGKVHQLAALVRAGDPESAKQAMQIYDALPAQVQAQKITQYYYLAATSNLPDMLESGSRYDLALNKYRDTYPNDPSAELHAIDMHLLKKDYEATHASVDHLWKITGDDYMKFYKGYIYMHEKKYNLVEEAARYWIATAPDDYEGYEMLLEAGFGQNKHDTTAEALTILEDDFGYDYSGVAIAPEWQNFRQTAAGKKWLEERQYQAE